jgi:RND family efflux transporter MFP subunit
MGGKFMKKSTTKAIALCAAAVTAAATFSGCSRVAETAAAESQTSVIPVEVSVVKLSDIKTEMIYAGQVSAAESVNVISRLTGKVLETYFDVGDAVNRGDILLRLDEKDILDQLRQLEAQIAQADSGIKTAENAVNTVTGGQFQAQVLQQETSIENYDKQILNAQIVLDNAKTAIENAETAIATAQTGEENAQKAYDTTLSQFENTKILHEAGLVAQNDFDRAELGVTQAMAALTQAQSGLKQARSGLTQAQNGLNQAQISYDTLIMAKEKAAEGLALTTQTVAADNTRQAQLAVDSAKASKEILLISRELAQNTLNDTSVTSPISGIISARTAKENEYVTTQAPAYVVVNIDNVYAEVRVSENIINSIKPGDEADIFFAAKGGEAVVGTVKTVAPAADQTGTYPVKIEITNPDKTLKPGMFAEIRFVKEQKQNAVTLPRSAVLSDETGNYVFKEEDNYAVKTRVETGIDNGMEIEITSGVNEGDRVITKGHTYVSDNGSVNVVAEN